MDARIIIAALAFALGACNPAADGGDAAPEAPVLQEPSEGVVDSARSFAPANEAATGASGVLSVSLATRMPDEAGAAPRDVLTLTGANGLIIEAELTGAATPAMQVDGQTLRGLLGLDVNAAQTLVYRVVTETKPESGQGFCGADAAAHIVVWESEDPAQSSMKLLGVSGAAPGESGARACPMLEYRRS